MNLSLETSLGSRCGPMSSQQTSIKEKMLRRLQRRFYLLPSTGTFGHGATTDASSALPGLKTFQEGSSPTRNRSPRSSDAQAGWSMTETNPLPIPSLIESKNVGLTTCIVSNARWFTESHCKCQFDWIGLSIDASNDSLHAKIGHVANLISKRE